MNNPDSIDLQAEINQHIALFFDRIGWGKLYEYEVKIKKDIQNLLEAYVKIGKWTIIMNISSDLLEKLSLLLENSPVKTYFEHPLLLNQTNVEQIFQQHVKYDFRSELHELIAEIIFHEVGHSRECPIDKGRFAAIIHGITTALEKLNLSGNKTLLYLANLFTDIIVNTINGLEKKNHFVRNGFFIYYYSHILNRPKHDSAFNFFLLINIGLFFFDQKMCQKLEEIIIPQMDPDYMEKLEELMHLFCPYDHIITKLLNHIELNEEERWNIINYISHSEMWGEMAYDFTLLIVNYIEPEEEINPEQIPHSNFTSRFQKDPKFRKEIHYEIIKIQETKKKTFEIDSKSKKSKSSNKQSSSSQKAKKAQYNKIPFPNFDNLKIGGSFLSDIDFLDNLYRHRIQEISLQNLQKERALQVPITWMSRSIMQERDNPFQFDPLKTFFLPNSDEMLIYKKGLPLTNDSSGGARSLAIPNLAIIYDDSGSMTWDFATGNGKYDAVIIMVYSIFHWLAHQSFASVINYNLSAFSTTTRTTGWVDYFHLEQMLPLLFNKEDGGTKLNPEKLKKIIADPRKKAILLITDGEIFQTKDILKILVQNRSNFSFLLVQIGKPSNFSKKLQAKGFSVFVLKKIQDLRKIALNFLQNQYSSSK